MWRPTATTTTFFQFPHPEIFILEFFRLSLTAPWIERASSVYTIYKTPDSRDLRHGLSGRAHPVFPIGSSAYSDEKYWPSSFKKKTHSAVSFNRKSRIKKDAELYRKIIAGVSSIDRL